RLLADRIRTASYGYGGIFTSQGVDSAALDQLRQFDTALQNETSSLAGLVEGLSASIPPGEEHIRAFIKELDRLDILFSARNDVVDTAKPSREQHVLDLLDTSEPEPPSLLLSVRRGDSLSILGDNFIANATITIVTNDGPLTLIR